MAKYLAAETVVALLRVKFHLQSCEPKHTQSKKGNSRRNLGGRTDISLTRGVAILRITRLRFLHILRQDLRMRQQETVNIIQLIDRQC